MIIDASASINMPQDIYNKSKKKDESEEIKPIEQSSESNNPELDFNKDKAITAQDDVGVSTTGDIYSNKGELVQKMEARENSPDENVNVDIFM